MQKHFGEETSLTRTFERPSKWKGNIKNDKKKMCCKGWSESK